MRNFLQKIWSLDGMFALNIVVFVLVVTGIMPRNVVPFFVLLLAVYTITAPIEEAVLFFVRSIPLFIAIPITSTFDNFNTWRIVSLIIFLRWIFVKGDFKWIFIGIREFFSKPKLFIKTHPVLVACFLLLFASCISLFAAADIKVAIARIIYFINLSMIGIVIYDLVSCRLLLISRVIRSIWLSVIVVVTVGYIQLATTYLMDVYQFMRVWGEGIQLRQFGTLWSQIAVRLGNTWLAYYGPQLSLRVFSLFPDSHTFPLYVLLGLPALLAYGIHRVVTTLWASDVQRWGRWVKTRGNMAILWVPVAFLIAILSGTRGIWAASVPVVVLAIILIVWMKKHLWTSDVQRWKRSLFKYISLYLIAFFMLFAVAYPIFVSPQFLLAKGDWGLLRNRVKSIVSFGETSNAARIQIWTKTIQSISQHPLLGVGIGNYPVVLSQSTFLAKAGSTAHNIYLHIAAELGIPALLIALWFLWMVFAKIYKNFVSDTDSIRVTYWGALLLFYPWVLAYLMTDAALFDERTFLLFVVTCTLVFSHDQ